MNISLNTPLNKLTTVGKVLFSKLNNLGLTNVLDLLFYFPFRYEDYSNIFNIKDAPLGEFSTVVGSIVSISNKITPYQRKKITEAIVSDGPGSIKAVWFNQPYLAAQLKEGDVVSLAGKIEFSGFGKEMRGPLWEKGKPKIHTGRILPVYPLTAGLTQKQVRFLIWMCMDAVSDLEDWFDNNFWSLVKRLEGYHKFQLLNLQTSIRQIHFPDSLSILSKAKYRLKFDELFFLQLKKARARYKFQKSYAPKLLFKENEIKKFVKSLPFSLTSSQKKVAWQILKDTESNVPMNRLLQGDVGSGKTIVALIAMLNCALNGYQSVLMVPTDILAKQHFKTIRSLFAGFDICIGIITRSKKEILKYNKSKNGFEKLDIKSKNSKIQISYPSIIIGTHALIQEKVEFKNIGLTVVDEQHRFGVNQRKSLKEKQKGSDKELHYYPHFLSMTATPIPRSLSLTLYGDLDISILDELPKGRKKVITRVIPPSLRNEAYKFISSEIKKGRQVFVICPLIDESDKLGVKAAVSEFEKLDKQVFPNFKVGILHGKMKDKEKDEIQDKFLNKEFDILVSTSVVEVGVDVPNASVMIIEGAERFGLAQLHQFRGRVGRSTHQSYCFLFTESKSELVYERLDFLSKTSCGFKIAEFDLKIRGGGNIYGIEQHGFPEFKIASLQDLNIIQITQKLARLLIGFDPNLKKFPLLKRRMEELGGDVHLE